MQASEEEFAMRIDAIRKGRSESMEEEGIRVKAEQVQVKEDCRRTSQRKTRGQFCGCL